MKQMSYQELMEKYLKLQLENENLKLENQNLKKVIFGVKREYTTKPESIENGTQSSLFEEQENKEVLTDEDLVKQIKENVEEITVHKKKKTRKRKAGIKKSYINGIDVKVNYIKLAVDEKGNVIVGCPECGGELELVGKKLVRQEIEYIPAQINIVQYVEHRYKCRNCGQAGSEKDTSTFYKAEAPKALLPHSFISPTLATEIIYQKYYLGTPLYRQEKMWDDKGLVIPRNMMAHCVIKVNQYYLETLWQLMMKQLKEQCEVLQCDETTIQVNKEEGRNAHTNSYMWVMTNGELEKTKGVVYKYAPSRSAKTAQDFLQGYKGILVTDRLCII